MPEYAVISFIAVIKINHELDGGIFIVPAIIFGTAYFIINFWWGLNIFITVIPCLILFSLCTYYWINTYKNMKEDYMKYANDNNIHV